MKLIMHKAGSRGHADHGWLNSFHSFSFGGYMDPSRVHFGALRVLNDDTVAPGRGFGQHPHDNMEIISIATEGSLEHSDTMGNRQVIRPGDVQVMSAGRGIQHAEKNHSSTDPVKFFQIWIFPNEKNITPRYDQQHFSDDLLHNTLHTVLSPVGSRDGGVQIHQDAWFSMGKLDKGFNTTYQVKQESNGIYAFVIDGEVTVNDQLLEKRDGLGIVVPIIKIEAKSDAHLLLMEVPMEWKTK